MPVPVAMAMTMNKRHLQLFEFTARVGVESRLLLGNRVLRCKILHVHQIVGVSGGQILYSLLRSRAQVGFTRRLAVTQVSPNHGRGTIRLAGHRLGKRDVFAGMRFLRTRLHHEVAFRADSTFKECNI